MASRQKQTGCKAREKAEKENEEAANGRSTDSKYVNNAGERGSTRKKAKGGKEVHTKGSSFDDREEAMMGRIMNDTGQLFRTGLSSL